MTSRNYQFAKVKPKNDKLILIAYKDYNWNDGYYIKTEVAKMINGECIFTSTIFNIKLDLDRIITWCYI